MREVRVSIELSRTPKRVWLKIIPAEGSAQIFNIASIDAVSLRNRWCERLSEDYDVVISGPIPKVGVAPRRLEGAIASKGGAIPYGSIR